MTEPRCVNAHDLCWQGGPCPYCEKPTRKQTKGLAHILPMCENKSPGRGNQAAPDGGHKMAYLLALLETVPGQVTLSVFARKVGMSEAAMRAELLVNPPLVDYFVKSMRQGMAEMEAA